MGREKEIEEMAEAIFQNCNCGLFFSEAEKNSKVCNRRTGLQKAERGALVYLGI